MNTSSDSENDPWDPKVSGNPEAQCLTMTNY